MPQSSPAPEKKKWPDRFVGPPPPKHDKDLIDLARKFEIPLYLEYGTKPVVHASLVPIGWDGTTLALKKFGGRKVVHLNLEEIGKVAIAIFTNGPADHPDQMDEFLKVLCRSPFASRREMAVEFLEDLDTFEEDDEDYPTLSALARDPSPNVRGSIADRCRSFTIRVRKTVMGTTYSMLDPDSAVYRLLAELAQDPHPEVRMKACFALGDHPNTPARGILEPLTQGDPFEDVRNAAFHALVRLSDFETVRAAYETALIQKAAKKTTGN